MVLKILLVLDIYSSIIGEVIQFDQYVLIGCLKPSSILIEPMMGGKVTTISYQE